MIAVVLSVFEYWDLCSQALPFTAPASGLSISTSAIFNKMKHEFRP